MKDKHRLLKLLSLDTSGLNCSVALQIDGECNMLVDKADSHSRVILKLIQQLLLEQNTQLDELDAIIVNKGPGSFTGLRIGVAVAQSLSYAKKIPLLGVSSLEALLHSYTDELPSSEILQEGQLFLSCIDARMEQVYACLYKVEQQGFKAISDECVISPDQILNVLPESLLTESVLQTVLIGSGNHYWTSFPEKLRKMFKQELLESCTSAKSVLSVVYQQILLDGLEGVVERLEVELLQPTYIRNNVAHQKTTVSSLKKF